MDSDSDPIKASYEVFVKPRISADRQVYILQFPNRDARQNYNAASGAQPSKVRVKPKAGMVEIDVPIDAHNNYDREKGVKWGVALKKSNISNSGGSHGLPGGFGIGGAMPSSRSKGRGNAVDEDLRPELLLEDYDLAVEKEQVLIKQTLGGQSISKDETTPQYMIGTFRKNQLHLTPIDNIVQMRPQFHHIDAVIEQERLAKGRDAAAAGKSEARAVHMTVKTQVDGDSGSNTEMPIAVRISAAQAEAWKTHLYIDEDADEAWAEYSESMFVYPKAESTEDILANVPQLQSAYNNAEYLDAISLQSDPARVAKTKLLQKKAEMKASSETRPNAQEDDQNYYSESGDDDEA
ncbi:unnamed protein product [Blumeria hordei]|uniref:Uncharacterized protein n=2 Tax=Blumeria hordei TaxID=2867405 RepID=A0A383URG3_BLUHO|nr:hypothetical protein BGHDH14_bgh04754 [Blumeria hordei DH14]SZF02165.1 unnamed protein product [Blumeria hordei]